MEHIEITKKISLNFSMTKYTQILAETEREDFTLNKDMEKSL